MNPLVCSLLAACSLAACASHLDEADDQPGPTTSTVVPTPPPRLKVSGTDIIDPTTRRPIVMTGYNWGQWNTAQPDDGTDNVRQGANAVRIPLRWWGDWQSDVDSRDDDAPGNIDPAHLALLDATIQEATDAHLWVTLFVDSNNGQGAEDLTNGYDNFWTDAAAKAKFVQVWQFLVKKYRDNPYLAAYEILPEPRPTHLVNGVQTTFSNDDVKAFYTSLIGPIRDLDPRTPIVVGPNDAYNLKFLDDAYDASYQNVIYTGDYFIFADGDPLQRMPYISQFLTGRGQPVWINQVGIRSGYPDPFTKADQVLGGLAGLGVGWAWWTFRENTTSPDEHGIYYKKANGDWKQKPDWYAFVPTYFWSATP